RAADLQGRGVINRFAVGHDHAGPYLEIRVSLDVSAADREAAQALFGTSIELPALRRTAPLRIVYIEGPAPRLLAAPRPPASGPCINVKDGAAFDGDNGVGTIGWCFELNGQPMCMSNWHVFCFDGNQSLRNVQKLKIIGQDSAVLFDFVPIQSSGNKLDIALALFND